MITYAFVSAFVLFHLFLRLGKDSTEAMAWSCSQGLAQKETQCPVAWLWVSLLVRGLLMFLV